MNANIFYSWQSDIPRNRSFILKSINKGIKRLNKERGLFAILDRDTKNELGSPNISDTVFKKIDRSKFFICDISLIGKHNRHPNENVLIELGYAVKSLGWERIICLFDSQTGAIEDLPFDINHNRVTIFNSLDSNEAGRIGEIIYTNFYSLFVNGQLFNPIEDHLKKKIDYIVIKIMRNIVNIFKFEQSVNYFKYLFTISRYSLEELTELLLSTKTLGFYYQFDYEYYQHELETILDKLLSCDFFTNSWRRATINFIDWIDLWTHSVDEHFSPSLLKEIGETDYQIKEMHAENPVNPLKSVLLLKHLQDDNYRVVQGGFLVISPLSNKLVSINPQYAKLIATRINELLMHIDFWMEESGGEFILDPHFYIIK